jgi:hypothetical protein
MRHVCLVALLAATLRPPDTDGNLKSVLGEEKLGHWRQYQNDQAGRGSSEPIAPVASKPTESSEGTEQP